MSSTGHDRRPLKDDLKRYWRVRGLFEKACANGERHSLTHASYDLALDCENPQLSTHWSGRIAHGMLTYRVDLAVRCRKCRKCQWRKTVFWTYRATEELRASSRTWWSTYTLRPELHYMHECELVHALRETAKPWDQYSEQEQFVMRAGKSARLFTNYIKRLRKGTAESGPVRFRYLVVCEPHTLGGASPSGGSNAGMPHFHAFWHELTPVEMLRKSTLEKLWTQGHTHHRLVSSAEDGGEKAAYLAKYIAKGNLGRTRCSLGYGDPDAIAKAKRKAYEASFAQVPLFCLQKSGTPPPSEIV